jgi:hypothetical protein
MADGRPLSNRLKLLNTEIKKARQDESLSGLFLPVSQFSNSQVAADIFDF